jgi:hypothetical protein
VASGKSTTASEDALLFAYDGTRQDPRFGTRPSSPTWNERQFSESFTSTVTGGIRTRVPLQIYDPTTVVSGGARTVPAQRDSTNRLSKVNRTSHVRPCPIIGEAQHRCQ